MYFSRELLLGLTLFNGQGSFNDDDISFTKEWLKTNLLKFKKNLYFFFNDSELVLDDFWNQYYEFNNGKYTLKNSADSFIICNATIDSLTVILKNNGFSLAQIRDFMQYLNTNYALDYIAANAKHLTK